MADLCSCCILPVHLPGITTDENNKCNYCDKYEKLVAEQGEFARKHSIERFEKVIERLRGKGAYDCLVPLSGGKDSSYLLHILVKKYNLRALAYNFDNGFQHEQARRNIENLVNKLNVDLIIYKPKRDIMLALFKAFLGTTGEFCTPCNMLINAGAFRFARQNSIKAIMSGTSAQFESGLEGISVSQYYDRTYYFNVAKDVIETEDSNNYVVPCYWTTGIRRLTGRGPFIVSAFDYIRLRVMELHQMLKEIGWEKPGGEIEHGDCLLAPVKDYLQYKKWGCSETTALYSLLVRSGEMTRQEALKKAKDKEPSGPPEILDEFLRAIKMTKSEFNEALKRDFREIPNVRTSTFFRLAKRLVQKFEEISGRR